MDHETNGAIARLCEYEQDLNDLSAILYAILSGESAAQMRAIVARMIEAVDVIETFKHVVEFKAR